MPNASFRRRAGFTLIELLVVVSIIAMLLAILMPSFTKARYQARKAYCLANLHNIGIAATSYLQDERDRFCWGPLYPMWGGTEPVILQWYFGGKRGKGSDRLGTGGPLNHDHELNWPADKRPLNRYVYAQSRFAETYELDVYRCPSDTGISWDLNVEAKPSGIPAYHEVGSSYMANLNWYQFAFTAESQLGAKRRLELADRVIRLMRARHNSRFILLGEFPVDWVLFLSLSPAPPPEGYKLPGWHGKANAHNVLFLDGRADAIYIDPAKNRNDPLHPDRHGTSVWRARHDYLAGT